MIDPQLNWNSSLKELEQFSGLVMVNYLLNGKDYKSITNCKDGQALLVDNMTNDIDILSVKYFCILEWVPFKDYIESMQFDGYPQIPTYWH